MDKTTIGVIGVGVVGEAIYNSLLEKKVPIVAYDKYKEYNTFDECLNTEMLFLCLPTPYSNQRKEYDKTELYKTVSQLKKNSYKGIILIKSTVEPGTTEHLQYESGQGCRDQEQTDPSVRSFCYFNDSQ